MSGRAFVQGTPGPIDQARPIHPAYVPYNKIALQHDVSAIATALSSCPISPVFAAGSRGGAGTLHLLINGSHVCFECVEISAIRRCPGLLVRARVLVVGEVTRPLIDGLDGGIYHGTVILL
jgi:hypothetical protein